MKKKKILLISNELTYSGAPIVLLDLAKALLDNGMYVEVYSIENGSFRKEFENLGINVSIKNENDLKSKFEMYKILDFDLVVCNTIVTAKIYFHIKKYVPTMLYIHEATNLPPYLIDNPIAEKVLRTSKDIYVVSEYAKEFIQKTYNNSSIVIHNGTKDFYKHSKKKLEDAKLNVLLMGSLNYRKRFDLVVNMLNNNILDKKYLDKIEVNIAGSVVCSEYSRQLYENIKLAKKVNYLGLITNLEEKLKLYETADVVIIPSMDESCPLVLLEAAMMGVPVIISENVGIKYLIDETCGWIVKTGEIEQIKQVVIDIIDGKYNLDYMSECIRKKYLQTLTIEIYNKNIIGVVNNKLKQKKLNKIMQLIKLIFS